MISLKVSFYALISSDLLTKKGIHICHNLLPPICFEREYCTSCLLCLNHTLLYYSWDLFQVEHGPSTLV